MWPVVSRHQYAKAVDFIGIKTLLNARLSVFGGAYQTGNWPLVWRCCCRRVSKEEVAGGTCTYLPTTVVPGAGFTEVPPIYRFSSCVASRFSWGMKFHTRIIYKKRTVGKPRG